MKKSFILLPALLLAFGCSSSEPTASGTTTAATSGSTDTAKKPDAAAPATTTGTADKGPKLSEVPAALKYDGYVYYGLDNPNPMNLEITTSAQPTEVLTGTQTTTLKSIVNGVPTFVISRTGNLDQLGVQELRVEKDGIYDSASTIAKIGPHDLEIPAKLTPGSTTWNSHSEVDNAKQKMTSDNVYKVERIEKVTTKAGEHEALLITSTGSSVLNGKKVKMTSSGWFVKDLGAVKTVLKTTSPDGKTETITIQETK